MAEIASTLMERVRKEDRGKEAVGIGDVQPPTNSIIIVRMI